FLPRTRYFFTGGIAYMGAELSQRQLEMFEKGKKKDIDPAISAAAKRGHRRFLLTLAKKHMPREYVEGQGPHTILAPASEGNDTDAADNARVITITEENYSLTLFPIELKKANQFFAIFKLKDGDSKARAVRVVQEGDTYATTHFFTGSGAVNGLRAATFAGQALNAGGIGKDWEKAAIDASTATDAMHRKVMYGEGNAPLDGPFNEPL
ncbi:MAG TPA: hypothetical protein VEL47_05290, partial [Myxococcota bacterium]|nr:hypothetical protein [Myxococcota bacterium]